MRATTGCSLFVLVAILLVAVMQAPADAIKIKSRSASNSHSLKAEATDDSYLAASSSSSPTRSPTTVAQGAAAIGNTTIEYWEEIPEWARIIVCVLAIIFGLINTYYGYRFFSFSVFMIGGFIAFLIMFGILSAAVSDSTANKAAIVYGVSAATWVVAGFILIVLQRVAIFCLGASVGVVIAIVLNPICLYLIWPSNTKGNLYLWMVIFGLITGIVTLYFERPILIVATALAGGLFVILGIGGMAGNLPLVAEIIDNPGGTPWEWWAYVGGWAALVTTGLIVQLCWTSKNRSHRSGEDGDDYRRMD